MSSDLQPRYSDIIFYTSPEGNISIEVIFNDETFWLSQKKMAELFSVDVRTVNEHLQNIYKITELLREATIRKIRIVQKEGNRDQEYEKYRIIQDQIFESDFDIELKKLTSKTKTTKSKKDKE